MLSALSNSSNSSNPSDPSDPLGIYARARNERHSKN